MTTIALPINADTVDLITALNGGSRPGDITYGKYYVCDIEDGVTSNRKFVSYDDYRVMRANNQSSFEVKTFTN